MQAGDAVVLFDGRGGEWDGTVAEVRRGAVIVGALRPRPALPDPPVAVTLAIGLLKADQMHDVVRDATVLGASAIVPFLSAHTARPASPRAQREAARWGRVAVAAAKQCGRAVLPDIHAPVAFADALAWAGDLRVACIEPALLASAEAAGGGQGAVRPGADLPRVPTATVYIGPEGGWSSDEVRALAASGARWLSLGPRTLRAEATPAVVLATLWATWGWT
jgi:16S rRNA (uracil1498-N3)-methyltransferase